MRKTLYEKIGRKYVPVAEYAPEIMNKLPEGDHLVLVRPGRTVYYYRINTDYPALEAAMEDAKQAMCSAMIAAATPRLADEYANDPILQKAQAAWLKIAGDKAAVFTRDSILDIVDAGLQVVRDKRRLHGGVEAQ